MSAPELSVTRHIAAPPDKVWAVMVDRMAEWWCPRPWTTEIDALDRRAGGRWNFTMRGPNGEVHPNQGTLLAWDEGRRFAGTDAVVGDLQPAKPFMIGIWEIAAEEVDGVWGTRYTATARHWSEDDRKQHEQMGFEDGWRVCADQLAELCEGS